MNFKARTPANERPSVAFPGQKRSTSFRNWAMALAAACGTLIWCLAYQLEQGSRDVLSQRLGEPDEAPAARSEREASRFAILFPAAAEAEAKLHKTAEQIEEEQKAAFAIAEPSKYAQEFEKFKTPERRALEVAARSAILNPVAHSGAPEILNRRAADQRARGSKPADDILDPEFESGNVAGVPVEKAPQLRVPALPVAGGLQRRVP